MIIPEVLIYNNIQNFLSFLFLEKNKNEKERFLFYLLRKNQEVKLKIENYDFYEQASEIFYRDKSNQRKVEVFLGYNLKRQNVPTIHITLSNEQNFQDGLGMDEGYDSEDIDGLYQKSYTRTFNCSYGIVITSDNSTEVLVIYHVLKAMMILLYETFELNGIRNLKLSGQDITMNNDIVPLNIFHKSLTMNFFYECFVPQFASQIKFEEFTLNSCIDNGEFKKIYNSKK